MEYKSIGMEILQGTTQKIKSPLHQLGDAFSYKMTLSSGGQSISKDSDTGEFTLSNTETLAMLPGRWKYFFYAISETETDLIQFGIFDIIQNPETTNPAYDARSNSKKLYDQYSALLGNASFVAELAPETLAELESFRKQLEWDIKRELDSEKLKRNIPGHSNKIYTRFV